MKLDEKALLSKLSISVWEGRKKDKAVEAKVEEIYKSKNAGSFRKILLDSPELKEIISLANKAREVHNKMTLPWNNDGTGILNIDLYQEYVKMIREIKDKFFETVDKFLATYETQKTRDTKRLGLLYNPQDYPYWTTLKHKFKFDINFLPLPSRDDFRIKLQSDEVAKVQEEFESHFKDVFAKATKDLYTRLYDVIQHLYEKLSDPKAIFRDTLISNIAELVQILPKLNITGDETLNDLTKLVEDELASLDPQELRENKEFRQATADLSGEILKNIGDIANISDPISKDIEDIL